MSSYADRNFNTGFQGLVTTTAIFAAVGGAAIIGYETLRQLRRLPRVEFVKFWNKDPSQRLKPGGIDGSRVCPAGDESKLTCEDWEMGHLYQARMFHAKSPSPPLARLPFAWVKQAIKFTDQFYADHTGMDTVVYVRFLRACLYWTLLQTLTTAPILLSIHIKFSRGVEPTDMSRASLSYLVTVPGPGCDISANDCARLPNQQGRSLLWIHLCLLWYLSITWVLALWWIGKGSLTIRRSLIDKTRQKFEQAKHKAANDPKLAYDQQSALVDPPSHTIRATQGLPSDTSAGWRHRTLMVMNLPPTMRDEASIRRYFEEFLRPDDASVMSDSGEHHDSEDEDEHGHGSSHQRPSHPTLDTSDETKAAAAYTVAKSASDAGATHDMDDSIDYRGTLNSKVGLLRPDAQPPTDSQLTNDSVGPKGPEPDLNPDRHLKSPVQTVVLVRKMNELSSMLARRQDVLNQLEAAHIKLAQNVMATVGKRTLKLRREAKRKAIEERRAAAIADGTQSRTDKATTGLSGFFSRLTPAGRRRRRRGQEPSTDSSPGSGTHTPALDELEIDLEKMAPVALTDEAQAKIDELARRLAPFSPVKQGKHKREAQVVGGSLEDEKDEEIYETVWEALHALPRELLDPYQPVTRLSALFRGQTVPTIDYLLTKLNLLTALVTEMRSRPPTSYESTSTAFVTFRDPRQARMVWRELKGQIVVKVRLAPEVKDLDWERLMRTSFTGDLVRGLGVNVAFWAFTIFWVVILNIITNTLFSVQSLKNLPLPGVRDFFNNNPNFEAFLSITLPTVIVSLITMSIPELIFQISKRAQGFVTFSALYDQCLVRYWKFVICNVVIFLCIGVTTVKTILSAVNETGKILDSIAFSFPTAAPFFVSYMILQLALQSGFEHVGFMIALLQHWGARKAVTPRNRALKTLPRNFNRYYWLPLHINIMAIQFIFAVLNPLVIPFALVYLAVALVVFKKNFAYHYYRRFNEKEGVIYFTRILRFSLDALMVMQVVLLIFFSVTKQGSVYIGMTAVLIPLTTILKVLATRLWKSQCRAIEDEEAEALCGIDSRPAWQKMRNNRSDYGETAHDDALDSRSPLDARASGRYPTVVPPPQTGSAFYRAWHKVHDSFHANGMDKPSHIAAAQARGHRVKNPVELGAKTLVKAPEIIVKKTAETGKIYTSAAKVHLGIDGGGDSKVSLDRSSARQSVDGADAKGSTPKRRPSPTPKPTFASKNDAAVLENSLLRDDLRARRAQGKRQKAEKGQSRVFSSGLSRAESMRSEERPFLSGIDAISAHAPVLSEEDAELSFADGDEPFLELHEAMARNKSIKRGLSARRPGEYSHGTIRRKGKKDAGRQSIVPGSETAEFGGSSRTEEKAQRMATDAQAQKDADQAAAKEGSRSSSKEHLVKAGPSASDCDHDDYDNDDDYDSDDDDGGEEEVLVRPHPPVQWDDTPNNTARYNNPFYNRELDPFLWLPRDPLAPLDLCDTIEWYGPAFVSSQGGPGRVGEWDDEEEDDEDGETSESDGIRFGGEAGDDKTIMFDGNEEIVMSDSLARHLEQVEDVDEVPDPATSLPRNLMEDYKRAIRRTSSAGGSSHGDEGDLMRSASHRSRLSAGESFRSPTLSARVAADERFFTLEPLSLGAPEMKQSDTDAEAVAAAGPSAIESPTAMTAASGSPTIPKRLTSAGSGSGERDQLQVDTAAAATERQRTISFGADMAVADTSPKRERRRMMASTGAGETRRARQGASYAASVASTNANRLVTLRAALKAEALEEERRFTIREKLASRKREASNAQRDPETTTHERTPSIMRRYEERVQRDTTHTRDASSASASQRFRSAALTALGVSRANTLQQQHRATTDHTALPMDELGKKKQQPQPDPEP